MTHNKRDTTIGLKFENNIVINEKESINVTKHNLYKYFKEHNIDWTKAISKKLLPDEAYYNPKTQTLTIYEKKYQEVTGSCDEKPQTCAFKIWEYRKLGALLNVKPQNVKYIYLLSSWFSDPRYKDMLEFIKATDGCDYKIIEVEQCH